MSQAGLPQRLFRYALEYTVFCDNRLPRVGGDCRYGIFSGDSSFVEMRERLPFGCRCITLLPKSKRRKDVPKSVYFLGGTVVVRMLLHY
jgi:hypothetical protein